MIRFENVLKRSLQDVLKKSSRSLRKTYELSENIRLEDAFKEDEDFKEVFKTSSGTSSARQVLAVSV